MEQSATPTRHYPTAAQSAEFDAHVDRLGQRTVAAQLFCDQRGYADLVFGFDALTERTAELALAKLRSVS